MGGAVASWLVRSTPERAVRVRALAGDSVLYSWARHFTLTVPLSTQVYKWVPAICWGNLTKLRGSDLRWTSIPSRGSKNTSSRFMLQKPGKLQGTCTCCLVSSTVETPERILSGHFKRMAYCSSKKKQKTSGERFPFF